MLITPNISSSPAARRKRSIEKENPLSNIVVRSSRVNIVTSSRGRFRSKAYGKWPTLMRRLPASRPLSPPGPSWRLLLTLGVKQFQGSMNGPTVKDCGQQGTPHEGPHRCCAVPNNRQLRRRRCQDKPLIHHVIGSRLLAQMQERWYPH